VYEESKEMIKQIQDEVLRHYGQSGRMVMHVYSNMEVGFSKHSDLSYSLDGLFIDDYGL
jgi:hypothetical protein